VSAPLDLEAIAALVEAATPGPWEPRKTVCGNSDPGASRQHAANTAFIAAAREAVPVLVDIAKRARALVAAADACDREAERHPSSRSSAPMVRYINAMAKLREGLCALRGGT